MAKKPKKPKQPHKFSKQARQELNAQIEAAGTFLGDLKKLQQATTIETISKDEARELVKDAVLNNRKVQIALATVVILLFGSIYGYHVSNQPAKGTKGYGVCRNFLELYVEYPQYLRLASVYEYRSDNGDAVARIWYSRLDAFGQYNMERMECFYELNPEKGTSLRYVTLDRREVDSKIVERFNAALPAIKEIDTDLSLPRNFPNSLRGLKFNADRFRRPLYLGKR